MLICFTHLHKPLGVARRRDHTEKVINDFFVYFVAESHIIVESCYSGRLPFLHCFGLAVVLDFILNDHCGLENGIYLRKTELDFFSAFILKILATVLQLRNIDFDGLLAVFQANICGFITDKVFGDDIFNSIVRKQDWPEVDIIAEQCQCVALMFKHQNVACRHTSNAFPCRCVILIVQLKYSDRTDHLAFAFVNKVV